MNEPSEFDKAKEAWNQLKPVLPNHPAIKDIDVYFAKNKYVRFIPDPFPGWKQDPIGYVNYPVKSEFYFS